METKIVTDMRPSNSYNSKFFSTPFGTFRYGNALRITVMAGKVLGAVKY